MKIAASIVLLNNEGLVLGVSRKHDHSDFGLPGGKMEFGDQSIKHTAMRECFEETGLRIFNMSLIFAMPDNDAMNHTFIAQYSGVISTKEPHIVKWCKFQEILDGSFGAYNELVRQSLHNANIKYI